MAYPPRLLDRLEQLDPKDWVGVVHRHMFARLQPTLENTGGARWNPKGTAAIYTSLERETALAEAEFRMALYPVRPSKGRTLYELRVRVSRVVDLRDRELLEELGLTPARLEDPDDYRLCQEVGGGVGFLGNGGMLVPSARRPGGANLVIYPVRPATDFEIEILRTEFIPS